MGWTGAAIPEEYGGAGLGHLGLCVLAEELGSALAPVPFSSSIYLASRGHHGRRQRGAEEGLAAEAGQRRGDRHAGRWPKGPARPSRASCARPSATARSPARSCRCPTATWPTSPSSAAQGERGPVARPRRPRRHRASRARPSRPSIPAARTRASPSTARPPSRSAQPGDGERLLRRVQDRAAVLFAFEQVGGAQRSLEMARDYALERYAFGRPDRLVPGHQAQAGRRLRRNRAGALQRLLRRLGARAAMPPSCRWRRRPRASPPTRPIFLAAKENIQVHGGMGFTWEFDCHLHYRRAKLLALALGSTRLWKDRLITQLETANAPL